jgi:HK97 family phage portal protein
VWACVRLISETVAMLPWGVYQGEGKTRTIQPDHEVHPLLRRWPNAEMTAMDFRTTLQAHVLLYGNGYAEIERNMMGDIAGLHIIAPTAVTPTIENDRLVYKVWTKDRGSVTLPPERIFHVKGLGFDGLQGYPVTRMAREAMGLGIAMEKHGGAFFGNGTHLGLVYTSSFETSEAQRQKFLENIKEEHAGPAKSHNNTVLPKGWEVKTLGVPPDEAQFLESRQFQVTEVARWYRVPPHKIGDLTRSTNNNIEHQSIEFVTDTILPWVIRWEQEADTKLFRPDEKRAGYFTKMIVNGLLRGDVKSRGEYYKTMVMIGAMSPNDVRELEDMNPVDNGDLYMVPLNMVSLEDAGNPDAEDPADQSQEDPPAENPPAEKSSPDKKDTKKKKQK